MFLISESLSLCRYVIRNLEFETFTIFSNSEGKLILKRILGDVGFIFLHLGADLGFFPGLT